MPDLIQNLINKKTAVAIGGPTACGKTALSLELAKIIPVEIISADSRQVFRYLDIGTAKPTPEELNSVPHHFIDCIDPDEYFSAGKFAREAATVVESIFAKNKIPLIVGGTGLYIKALCSGFFEDDMPENCSADIRTQLEIKLNSEGIDPLYKELQICDPTSAELYKDKNPRRIIRSLEYFLLHKIPFSEAQKKFAVTPDFSTIQFCITENREDLYARINSRTLKMWESGLKEETEKVLEMGFSPEINSLNTVGYKETIDFLNNKTCESEAIQLIAQHTRNYAKRQMTWFRKVPGIIPIGRNVAEIINALGK